MEREGIDERAGGSAEEAIAGDDEEFASIEDVGPEPSENPPVDDV